MASPTITTLITIARTLAAAQLVAMESYRNTQPLQCDIVLGNHRLAIQFNGSLYFVIVIDLAQVADVVCASTNEDDGVLASEWDSSVATAIELCAAKLGV